MNVYIEDHSRQDRWWVHLDVWMVSFRSLEEATDFVDRLNARLSAPHSFALIQDKVPRMPALETRVHGYGKGPSAIQ